MARLNVLLIEDDTLFSQCVKKKLENFCQVSCEHNFDQGAKAINKIDWDLVILDLKIHHAGDGLELAKASCEKKFTTLILSGSKDNTWVEKSLELGVQEFFSKWEFQDKALRFIEDFYLLYNLKQVTLEHLFSPFPPRPQVCVFFLENTKNPTTFLQKISQEINAEYFPDTKRIIVQKDLSNEDNSRIIFYLSSKNQISHLQRYFEERNFSWFYCDSEEFINVDQVDF